MSFPRKFSQLLKESGLSYEAAAPILGVSRATVGNLANGSSQPSGPVLLRISDHWRVSLDYLLRDECEDRTPAEAIPDDARYLVQVVGDLGLSRAEAVRRLAYEPDVRTREMGGTARVIAERDTSGLASQQQREERRRLGFELEEDRDRPDAKGVPSVHRR